MHAVCIVILYAHSVLASANTILTLEWKFGKDWRNVGRLRLHLFVRRLAVCFAMANDILFQNERCGEKRRPAVYRIVVEVQ